jgi:hypothetical protein
MAEVSAMRTWNVPPAEKKILKFGLLTFSQSQNRPCSSVRARR